MDRTFLNRILLAASLMATMTTHGQEPLVIQPAKAQSDYFYARGGEPMSVLNRLNVVVTQDKIVSCAVQGMSSGLGVNDLNTLEEELRFYFGRFAHKGRIREEVRKIEYDLAKAKLEQNIKAIWDPRNYNPLDSPEYWKRYQEFKGRPYSEYFNAMATEQERITKAWFESLQEGKQPPDGKRPPGNTQPYIGDSGMYGGSVMAVSPDGSFFYCWERDYAKPVETRDGYWVVDLKTEQKRPSTFNFRGKIDQPFKISPDGKWGVVRSYDVVLTDPITGETKKELKYPYHIEDVFFSADSKYVVAIGGEAYVWEVGTWKRLGTLDVGLDGNVRRGFFKDVRMDQTKAVRADFSPSGRYLFQLGINTSNATKNLALGQQSSVIWDIKKDRLLASIPKTRLIWFEGWGPTDDLGFFSETDHLALVHLPTGKTVAKLMQPPDGVSRIIPKVHSTSLPFRTFCRASDGLVLSEYMRQSGEIQGTKEYTGYLIRWDLRPVMADILKRAEALGQSGK